MNLCSTFCHKKKYTISKMSHKKD